MHAHKTDWLSLVSGLVFLLIGAGAIVSAETGLIFDGRWLAPAALLVVAVGVLAAVRGRDLDGPRDETPVLSAAETEAMKELNEL